MKVVATAKNLNINVTNDQGDEVIASYLVENHAASFDLAALLRGIKPLIATITEIAKEINNVKK